MKFQIYWVDIKSHSSRSEMILMVGIPSSEFMFEFRKWDLYISPIDWCENQNLGKIIDCDLASKCDLEHIYIKYTRL